MTFRPFTDAGHGGQINTGTHDSVFVEKDIVLDIEDRLHTSLAMAPFYCGRSRSFDGHMTQEERGAASLSYRSTFVASLHINDCPFPQRGGLQLYVGENNPRTWALANEIASGWGPLFGSRQVLKTFKPKDPDEPGISAEEREDRLVDQWIEAPRSIILAHIPDVILFEIGFRQNPHDRELLLSDLGREEIASLLRWSLVRAARYYGSL